MFLCWKTDDWEWQRCFSFNRRQLIKKPFYANQTERCFEWEFMIGRHSYTHNLSRCEILRPEKKKQQHSRLNGIRTHDLCDTGAVLYQLSYQAIWELVTLWVRNIPIEVKDANEISLARKYNNVPTSSPWVSEVGSPRVYRSLAQCYEYFQELLWLIHHIILVLVIFRSVSG